MPRPLCQFLFVGIRHSVVALDTRDGSELWRSKLGGMTFVTVHWDGEELFASAKGEVFKLDPRDGAVLWHSPLKGLGTGSVTLASTRHPTPSANQVVSAERTRQEAQAAAAAGAGAT